MAEIVRMPLLSDTMTEGTIATWHKKVGDSVESGELMAEIETDKATMEYESYNDGVVLYLGADVGGAIEVNGILAIVGEKGEDYKALLDGAADEKGGAVQETTEEAPAAQESESIDVSGINAEIVRMPLLSDTMKEGTIAAWRKKVGDAVESGELMAEIETDKATMEYESYNDGTVLYLGAEVGGGVTVDGVLAIVGEAGADWETLLKAENNKGAAPTPQAAEEPKAAPAEKKAEAPKAVATASSSSSTTSADGGRVKASPLAKKLAEDKGFNINDISGTGPNGRVIKLDVEGFTPSAAPSSGAVASFGAESFEDVKLNGMRKAIAKKVSDSKFSAPHFYITMDIDMDKAIEARKSMNEISPSKISFNDLVVKASAMALKQHPNINTHWLDDSIRYNHHVHVGVAIAVGDSLFIPKVDFTDTKSLSQISASVKDLAGKAKEGKLTSEEMTGATFTISNLGMFGIEQFTAIVNPPATCIMAVGGISQVPVVKNGQIVPGNVMKVTLSCDHRAVDGAVGAAFLKTFKELLEDPVRILV